MANENIKVEKYEKDYSEEGFFDKITKYAQKIGGTLVLEALELFYVAKKDEVPVKVKATIMGALGYLILPLDLIPDFTPVVGYTDDLTAIAASYAIAKMYVDDDVEAKARERFIKIFSEKTYNKVKAKQREEEEA